MTEYKEMKVSNELFLTVKLRNIYRTGVEFRLFGLELFTGRINISAQGFTYILPRAILGLINGIMSIHTVFSSSYIYIIDNICQRKFIHHNEYALNNRFKICKLFRPCHFYFIEDCIKPIVKYELPNTQELINVEFFRKLNKLPL